MILPTQVKQLISEYKDFVWSNPSHYLTASKRKMLYESFGNDYHFYKWLAVVTASKVIPIWENTYERRASSDSPYKGLPQNMLKAAQDALLGRLDAEHNELIRSAKEVAQVNGAEWYLEDLFWIEMEGGIDARTTLTENNAVLAAYGAFRHALASNNEQYFPDDVMENALVAYTISDENPPGVWHLEDSVWVNSEETNFFTYLKPFPIGTITELLKQSAQLWTEEEKKENFATQLHLNYIEEMLNNLSEFKPFRVDLQKALDYWEWWLTEAVPQAWELRQQSS